MKTLTKTRLLTLGGLALAAVLAFGAKPAVASDFGVRFGFGYPHHHSYYPYRQYRGYYPGWYSGSYSYSYPTRCERVWVSPYYAVTNYGDRVLRPGYWKDVCYAY
jgi:hypothetical protein